MAIEPLHAEGAELWVERNHLRTYDQVKFRSAGQWTPARLRNDGVLQKLSVHYAAGAEVYLVLSQPSEDFERLIGLARATNSVGEFEEVLDDSEGFPILVDAWGATPAEAWTYLRQTTVRHDGVESLREFVRLALEHMIVGKVDLALGLLRQLLDDRMSTTLTAPQVWNALAEVGIRAQPRWNTGPAATQLQFALDAYVSSIRASAPSVGTVGRYETGSVVEAINDSVAPIVLISGRAGAGKSVVLADAIAELSAAGRHVAPIRLDRVDPRTSTAHQLGAALELGASPVSVLSDLSAPGLEGVLVFDQLDAVSAYSGRMPAVFDAVNEAINQARVLGNVRIILAVRDVDLREDPRLRKLVGENAPTIEVGELDADDVKAYLATCGFDPDALDATTLRLLRLPIHLFVFVGLDSDSRAASYSTLTSLYAAFVKSVRRQLISDGQEDHWSAVTSALVSRMNADEALAVSESVLDAAPINYVDALISSGVVVKHAGRLALFHETFFDYLFASAFEYRGGLLLDWFEETGQGLFRRSQLRQLLAYIATTSRETFIEEFLAIAESDLRPHLISIAYSVLAEFHPEPDDWVRVRHLLINDNPFASKILSLVSGPRWFGAIDETGDVERLLDEPAWSEAVAGQVARLSSDVPDRVLQLLSKRQGQGDRWIEALRMALELADAPLWADFVIGQLASSGLDLPSSRYRALDIPLLQRLLDEHPREATRLLVAALEKEVDSFVAEGNFPLQVIFDNQRRHLLDGEDLQKLAKADEAFFVENLLPLVLKIASYKPKTGLRMWEWRQPDRHSNLGDELYFQFDESLTSLAEQNHATAQDALDQMQSQDIDSLNFLVCRALAASDAHHACQWLLESETHWNVGWVSNPRWETRRLIQRISRDCSDYWFATLEAEILFRDFDSLLLPPVDPRRYLRWQGRTELELLSAMCAERLSEKGRRRLSELERRFPFWTPSEPEGVSGGFVHSPISRAASQRMTDVQWTGAIERYRDEDRTTFRGDRAFGGTRELAAMMGNVAKEQPYRFLRLAQSFGFDTPAAYTEHLLRGLASVVSQEDLLPLIRKFRCDHPHQSGRAIVAALDSYVSEMSDEVLGELLLLANDGDPERELAREQANSESYSGSDFMSAGLNSTRGAVAGTLARVLFTDHSRVEIVLPALQMLAQDQFVSVRSMLAEAALAYASIDRGRGLDMIEELLGDDDVLGTSAGLRALRWSMLWDAQRFSSYLDRALRGSSARAAGNLWANCFVNDALGDTVRDVGLLPQEARIGVARALSSNPDLAPDVISRLFDDESFDVRAEASRSLHVLGELEPNTRNSLVGRFVASSAFLEHAERLLDALEEVKGSLPDATLHFCGAIVEHLSHTPPLRLDVMTRDLVAVLVRLYRASSKADRRASLDLIDATVLMQIWFVEQTLDEAR
jgi:hypothetical protein